LTMLSDRMIGRRAFLASVAVFVAPLEAVAQPRSGVPRVGVLAQDIQPGRLETFRDELQRLGYVGLTIPRSLLLRADQVIE